MNFMSWRRWFGTISGLILPKIGQTGIVLPEAVRTALSAQNGNLFKKDLEVLATREYRYTDSVIYLLAKMLHPWPELQKRFLAEVSFCCVRGPDTRALVRAWIGRIDPSWGVPAAKIIQLNRQGFELWDDLYRQSTKECAGRGLPLVLVAYATLVGFRWAVRTYQQTEQDIFIVSHLLTDDPTIDYCGYRLSWRRHKPQVDFLSKSFSWPEAVIILEDTVKEGITLRTVKDYIVEQRPDIRIEEIILNRTSPGVM